MSAQHTPAPWFVFSTGHCIGGPKPDRDPPTAGIAMFSMGARSTEENLANAAHAVKCVNAHDELIAKLHDAARLIDHLGGSGKYLREAIAKATGSAT
jgi:hypothetical protein